MKLDILIYRESTAGANLKSSTSTSTFIQECKERPMLMLLRAICGHNKENADDSDVLDFFIRCWSTGLAFNSILVSMM